MVGLFSQFYKRAKPAVNYRKESNFLYTIKLSVLKLCLRKTFFKFLMLQITSKQPGTCIRHCNENFTKLKNGDKKPCFSMNTLSQIVLSLREIQSSEKSGEKLHYNRCPFQFS